MYTHIRITSYFIAARQRYNNYSASITKPRFVPCFNTYAILVLTGKMCWDIFRQQTETVAARPRKLFRFSTLGVTSIQTYCYVEKSLRCVKRSEGILRIERRFLFVSTNDDCSLNFMHPVVLENKLRQINNRQKHNFIK